MNQRKRETLRGYRAFSTVIAQGLSATVPPLRVFYQYVEAATPGLQVGFATSRQFRSAASRNRLKRLMREAFRFHRGESGVDRAAGSRSLRLVVMYTGSASRDPKLVRIDEVRGALGRLLGRVTAAGEQGAA